MYTTSLSAEIVTVLLYNTELLVFVTQKNRVFSRTGNEFLHRPIGCFTFIL